MGKAAGITVLVLGVLVLGAGFGIDYYATNLVVEQLPDALKQVRDEGLPQVKPGVYEDFTDDLLLTALEEVNDTLGGEGNIAAFVNGSTFLLALSDSLAAYMSDNSEPDINVAVGNFMNNPAYNYLIPGISMVATGGVGTLGFTPTEIGSIMGGNSTAIANATMFALTGLPNLPMPGIGEVYNDFIPGCVLFVSIINGVSGNPTYEAMVSNCYGGADFTTKLVEVKEYLEYIFSLVPAIIGGELGYAVPACTPATALDYIKLQWATKALLSGGLKEVDPDADGFEVGSGNWTSFAQILKLWNTTDSLSLTYDGGGKGWYAALTGDTTKKAELQTHFGLSDDLMADILRWYGGEFETLVKFGIKDELGIEGDNIYARLFYAQWNYMPLDDEGFALYEEGDVVIKGFELKVTKENAIPYDTCVKLWDEKEVNSFLTLDGVKLWLKAAEKPEGTEYATLKEAFKLTDVQMKAVGDWLIKWRDVTLPALGAAMGELPDLPLYGTDVTKLRHDSGLYLPIAGGILAALGIVLLLLGRNK
jgi:hypothetical protein